MTRLKRSLSAAGLLLLLISVNLFAQVKIHQNLNIEDGLIYSQVLFIHEDQQGYMWFGTSSGISRWDGISFKNFILPEGLSDNNCKWIAEFSDSTLFFATRKGLVKYKNNKFSKIQETPPALNHWIHGLLVTNDDKLFIATDTSGLWIYDGQNFTALNSENGLPGNSIHALGTGTGGRIYIGLSADIIFSYQNGTLNQLELNQIPPGLRVNTLFEDSRGALWIGTQDNGVFIHDQGRITKLNHSNGLPSSNVTQITNGGPNQVFAATDNGLAIVENYRVQSVLNEKSGLSNNFIWYVNQDRSGTFYIGTDGGGVDIYQPGVFQTINTDCGLPHNTVWAIQETQNHDFYFGTDKGLAVYDGSNVKVIDSSSGLSDDMVLCLHEGSDGRIYIGTNEQGVDIIDKGHITNISAKNGLDGPSVWTITEDSKGLIYFGTYDGGVNIWDGRQIIDTVNVSDGLLSNAIVSSFKASDGSLYFGTDGNGVFRLVNGKIDTFLLKGNTVWSIYENSHGDFFFGTNDRGLIFLRDGIWDTLSIDNGLTHNSILGILECDQGNLYLTADNGLNIVEFSANGYRVRTLGKRDGLAGSECNQGAYFKDSQGCLWFGTVNGASRFDPSLFRPNTNAPKLHLTRLQLFNQDLQLPAANVCKTFKYNENYLKFDFIGIDLSAPHKVNYKYRLSGIDQDWIYSKNPNVQYTSLDDNNYTLEIMAGNEWGMWSKPLKLSFTVLPPFWETWWFILIAVSVTVSPLFVVIRQRILRLQELEQLRAKISADLHDDIGTGLSEINILSAVAAAKAPAEVKPLFEAELNKISRTAGSLVESMSDIVWLVNPKKDTLTDLISRLRDSFCDIFEAKNIVFSTKNTEVLEKIRLKMDYRQHLFLILKEAVHNAVKYSSASEIQLSVHLNRSILHIQLKDDGRGFVSTEKGRGNGLRNMHERAAKINGHLTVTSENNKGTVMEFEGKI